MGDQLVLHAQRETNKRKQYLNSSSKTGWWEMGGELLGLCFTLLTEATAVL